MKIRDSILKSGLMGTAALIASHALATPTLYPTDFNVLSRINNPTNSNLIADDADPRTIYVMPPNEGYSYVTGIHTLTANLGFCSQLSMIQEQSRDLLAKEHELRLKEADQESALENFDQKIMAAKLEAAKYATANHLSELAKIEDDLAQVTSELNQDYTSLDSCKESCGEIENDVKVKRKQQNDLRQAKTQFESKNLAASRVYDSKKAAVDALVEQKGALLENYNTLISALAKDSADLLGLYTSYGVLEGGRAAISYRSDWNDNVATLRIQNPGYNFALINTQNAVVYPGVLGVAGLPVTGAVIGFEAPGSAGMKDGGIQFSSYPSEVDGNIVLSLIGACPMVHPEMFQFNSDSAAAHMKYGMLTSYEFPSTMKLSMTATYNMYKLYQLVKTSGSSGGLFSSHSWTNSEERNYFHDGFSVDWKSQDPSNMIDDDKRMAMERDVRNDLFSRLLTLAIPQAPDKSMLINVAAAPLHGSIVVADSLMTACPGNGYCIAGSMVLRALDAIFGSSSVTASMTQIQDITLTDTWSMSKVVMKPWITSYKAE